METISLNIPKLNQNDLVLVSSGLRPLRKGGIRYGEEEIKDKVIYHNYGHGGAGVSMSYGSAQLSVYSLNRKYPRKSNPKVAVMGGGYIGLYTAKILTERGYQVTLYTQNLPNQQQTDVVGYNLASQAAGGYWMPYGYDLDVSNRVKKEYHDLSAKITFDYFQDCVKTQKYKGIRTLKCMHIDKDPKEMLKDIVPPLINLNIKEKFLQVNGGQKRKCYTFESIMMEGSILLNELMQECYILGVVFKEKTFNTIDDVLLLEEKTIFNCLGLGAGKVFNDPNMIPNKGTLAWVKPIPGLDYHISYENEQGVAVTTYPWSKRLGIGKSIEPATDNIPSEKTIQFLINNFNLMVSDLERPQPKL